jgi:hypothetical protein
MPTKEKRRSYYSPPSIDGERQGAFYINVDDISALKKYETMSLTLHESNPGSPFDVLFYFSGNEFAIRSATSKHNYVGIFFLKDRLLNEFENI